MQFQDKHTLRYVPGRLYEKTGVKKAAYLREEREGAVPRPKSFSSLDIFLKERRLELADFLAETTEVAQPMGKQVVEEDMEVDGEEGGGEDEVSDLEDELDQLADSAGEDLSDIDDDDE